MSTSEAKTAKTLLKKLARVPLSESLLKALLLAQDGQNLGVKCLAEIVQSIGL